ncbi:hypothetical protein BV20DRAFT_1058256 [Pilatotrama ljubarskyi]|nr:hypothetical protein BV20DRAFT_1058256 [Pilatotrama ljubarskyi]
MDMRHDPPALPPPVTPAPKARQRGQQPVGKHFATPEKRRAPQKDGAFVSRPELALRSQKLNADLHALLEAEEAVEPHETPENAEMALSEPMEPTNCDVMMDDCGEDTIMETGSGDSAVPDPAKRAARNHSDALISAHVAWLSLIPSLLPEYLGYMRSAHGRTTRSSPNWSYSCPRVKCVPQSCAIMCLYYDYPTTAEVVYCECTPIANILVRNGLFPTSPTQPRVAVSIDLLDFYMALFERSADAVSALAAALRTFYQRRGFPLLNHQGEPVRDPFRRGMGNAIQWYDHLQHRHEAVVEEAIDECLKLVQNTFHALDSNDPKSGIAPHSGQSSFHTPAYPAKTRLQVLMKVGNAQVPSMVRTEVPPEGCMGHLRMVSVKVRAEVTEETRTEVSAEVPWRVCAEVSTESRAEDPSVVRAEARLEVGGMVLCELRTINPQKIRSEARLQELYNLTIPDMVGWRLGLQDIDGGDVHVAMDATFSQRHNVSAGDNPWHHDPKYFISKEQVDAKSFEAADEKKEKTHGKKFDDTGLMALVCRHDVVLFLANVDTPGEQQKYAIALLEHFFLFLPQAATVAAFYDIGCVIDRSVQTYDILPIDIVQRLQFATLSIIQGFAKASAYRRAKGQRGYGRKFRKLIGVTRTSGRERRLWLLDRHAESINEASYEELGSWICSRLKNGVEARTAAAEEEIIECGATVEELREQWKLQRTAQLSVRQHAPARLKQELDSVLSLQTELDAIEQHFVAIESSIEAGSDTPIAREFLNSLRRSHASTLQKVEELYASLNLVDNFPELRNLPLEFVRTLLMARDLKINIWKRAIGSFFEWDKLDRAAGGRDQPLGTKLHQQTRKAIAKRTPALVTAIRKFNKYCDTLEDLYKPEWKFPLPRHLPTELGALREDSSLLIDVWTTPTVTAVPRWLEDNNIRKGIRAMLMKDRCLEKRRRLGNEADNLCRWYGRELAAVELALRLLKNFSIHFILQHRRGMLLLLQSRWQTPLVSPIRFDACTRKAGLMAQRLSGVLEAPPPVTWIQIPIQEEADLRARGESEESAHTDVFLACDTLEELYEEDHELSAASLNAITTVLASSPVARPLQNPSAPSNQGSSDMLIERALYLMQLNPRRHMVDVAPLADIPQHELGAASSVSVIIPATKDLPRVLIPAQDMHRFVRSTAWLSDDCINGGAQVLLRYYGTSSIHIDDNTIWRDCGLTTAFWRKEVWIVPIHRTLPSMHWTLAVVYWRKKRIAYFNSLADQVSWQTDVQSVYSLIYKLHRLANEHHHTCPSLDEALEGEWGAYPLVESALQENGHDCGVWVLACIAALLRGYHVVQLTGSGIVQFRSNLRNLIMAAMT